MRALLLAGLLAALFLVPVALADQEQGRTTGMNLGYIVPGVWDAYYFQTGGGSVSITLTWAPAIGVPFADYDLRLYRPGALSNNELSDVELLAQSSNHPYAHHSEAIHVPLAPGTYVVAIAPFQAQMELYTLNANPGNLDFAAKLVGFQSFS